MPLIVFLFCVLFAAALDATEIEQATQQNISAHIQKQSNLTFSNYENRIEQLSLKHNQDNLEMLAALNQFNEQNPTNNLNDVAYLLSYRCYLELVNNQQDAYQQTEQSLLALTISSASDPAISEQPAFVNLGAIILKKMLSNTISTLSNHLTMH